MVKYLVLLGLSLGLVACGNPVNDKFATSAEVIRDKNNPCIIYMWNEYLNRTETFVVHIIGCDPNKEQRLPE